MSLERVTITIPSETLEAVRSAAEREGLSVSAWLSRAAEHAAKIEAGLASAEEAMAHLPPPTPEEQAWVDAVMEDATRPAYSDEYSAHSAHSDDRARGVA
ncbi:ribbon-helix-helix protein, CopG family [Streptomyces sp. ADMS]|uniref:ribbon-helix-helix protein, CopG family n=1 Tax=Streptomyces sp. ADMS TaxID=3071415 RepID=UPI00296F4E19|nr:ribbon-helix-helix protein, CopG family [Streptomyces sp. ADMS]MDW4907404.1 ribbon-helix-helix protein, CopG family [Streptomyces sp. ADMS]